MICNNNIITFEGTNQGIYLVPSYYEGILLLLIYYEGTNEGTFEGTFEDIFEGTFVLNNPLILDHACKLHVLYLFIFPSDHVRNNNNNNNKIIIIIPSFVRK